MINLDFEKDELLDLANLLLDELDGYAVRDIKFLRNSSSDILYGNFRFSSSSEHHELVLSSYGHIIEYGENVPVRLITEINFAIIESLRKHIDFLGKG
jgi:hypothetical protein